jgi:predicted ATPase/class 3 adenylate cyclase
MTTDDDRASLPKGTVAFLMTDIEGSTQAVSRLGTAWPPLLDEHFALIRRAIEAHQGTWISSEGDAVFVVFRSVREAIGAGVEAQRGAATAGPTDGERLKVRIGIHAGEAVVGGRDYTGMDVHRTARLTAAGHGGQILVSEAAHALMPGVPGPELTYRDLGTYRLRDIPAPERIRQVVGPGLASEFPPLVASTLARTNLPSPLTRFVGRSREVAEVADLLRRERLVTLTGPGGTGKTRVAIETAAHLLGEFQDGVWFVALDVLREPRLVIPTIAATLGVSDQSGRSLAAALSSRLADEHALLVLDNFEQVVEAAPDVGDLLRSASRVRVLASSREPMAIAGEAVYPIAPLAVPAEPGRPTAGQLEGLEAVDLFVDRATAARPDFRLTDANAPAVAAICRRLDGLPLALELAAARSNLLSPDQILARLNQRLTLLASSRRDLPDRQRTLRGAIDWSHDLLSDSESVVFRRFSVFSGGADVDSLASVLDPEGELGIEMLDLASGLVDRSLLGSVADGEKHRLGMLETIREYAAERLEASGESRMVHDRHLAHFRQLAEGAKDILTDPRRDEMLDRLDRELPNLRAALRWALDGGDVDAGLAIVTGLNSYWTSRGGIGEARVALTALLQASGDRPLTAARARGTALAASLAGWHVDFAAAGALGAEALRLAEELGDPELRLAAYVASGWGAVGPAPAVAREHFLRAIELAGIVGDDAMLRLALGGLSVALLNLGELDEALAVSIDVAERSDRAGDAYNAGYARMGIGQIKVRLGDTKGATSEFVVALRRFRDAGADIGIAVVLDLFALIALQTGDAPRAARLGGFAERLRREAGGGGSTLISNDEPPLVQARRVMDSAAFDRAVAEGEALDLEEAELEALRTTTGAKSSAEDPAPGPASPTSQV